MLISSQALSCANNYSMTLPAYNFFKKSLQAVKSIFVSRKNFNDRLESCSFYINKVVNMTRFYAMLIAILLSIVSVNALANVKIIFATVPPDREVVVPPHGYARCQTVAAGFYDGVWMNKHKVCNYSRNHGMWISGYWQCSKVKKGFCARWDWAPSRWEGGPAPVAVYNPPMPPRPAAYPVPAVAYAPAPVQRPPVPAAAPAYAPVPVAAPGPVVGEQQPAPSPVGEQLPPQRV